jgi:hypothetical protein
LIDRLIDQSAPSEFSRELRRAIASFGQPLVAISKRLAAIDIAISPATLSAWQRGRSQPNPDQRVHALERLLKLPAGHLSLRLTASPRPPAAGSGDTADLQAELSTRASMTRLSDYVIIAITDEVHVDESDQITVQVRQTVRAVRSGVDSAWFFYTPEAVRPKVSIQGNDCRVGRRLRLADGRYAAELLFDRRLERGQEHSYTFRVVQKQHGSTDPVYRRSIRAHTVEKLEVQVIFARPPRSAWLCHWSTPATPTAIPTVPDDRQAAALDDATATLVQTSPAPGAYGIRWSY